MTKVLSFAFVATLFLSLYSCTVEVDRCDEDQASADSTRIQELSQIYIDDITNDDKCQDFVDAVRKFVSDYRGCDGVDQSSIDQIETSVEALPCA